MRKNLAHDHDAIVFVDPSDCVMNYGVGWMYHSGYGFLNTPLSRIKCYDAKRDPSAAVAQSNMGFGDKLFFGG